MTCWDIWHKEWKDGKLISLDKTRRIRMRRPHVGQVQTPTTKKKKQRVTPATI